MPIYDKNSLYKLLDGPSIFSKCFLFCFVLTFFEMRSHYVTQAEL